jgi:hypothetical protein
LYQLFGAMSPQGFAFRPQVSASNWPMRAAIRR